MKHTLTVVIQAEGDMYVALCSELDIASQGYTIDEARHNLNEATTLFLEYASDREIKSRLAFKSPFVVNPEIEAAWIKEADARLAAYERGEMEVVPFDEVMKNLGRD